MFHHQNFTIQGASARMIEDTISPDGIRLSTILARYPRMVHADAKTHRLIRGWTDEMMVLHHDLSLLADENLSRNGRSSRAVPTPRLLAEAADPYVPHFLSNQRGMSAGGELAPEDLAEAEMIWRRLAALTLDGVRRLNELGVHKQWANRPLEWFGYIDVLITATDWTNFFVLRDHPDAQPEVQDLAKAVRMAMDASTPRRLFHGEWHLPFVDQSAGSKDSTEIWSHGLQHDMALMDVAIRVSVARCARLTYEPFNGEGSIAAEIDRHDKLVVSQPVHASPAEHQATPDQKVGGFSDARGDWTDWANAHQHGNLRGFRQYRKLVANEFIPG